MRNCQTEGKFTPPETGETEGWNAMSVESQSSLTGRIPHMGTRTRLGVSSISVIYLPILRL